MVEEEKEKEAADLVEEAKETAERIEEANRKREELITLNQELILMQQKVLNEKKLSGNAEAGQPEDEEKKAIAEARKWIEGTGLDPFS
mgnify:CR=1 FL=1